MTWTQRNQGLQVKIRARQHLVNSDVESKLGGTDLGMNPHEILEAALGACTSITVQMYADRKQISLESANVDVKIEKEGDETVIRRTVELIGDLSPEQKQKLMEIANKCPIHKILKSKIQIVTEELVK